MFSALLSKQFGSRVLEQSTEVSTAMKALKISFLVLHQTIANSPQSFEGDIKIIMVRFRFLEILIS